MNYRHLRICSVLLLLTLFLAACDSAAGSGGNQGQSAAPTAAPVNGFGIAANHVHSLAALSDHIVLLATHYGIYRSSNDGATWEQVSGGSNQLMDGLMEYSLSVSPLDRQWVYVATQPSLHPHSGKLGIYASSDEGRTWKLAIPTSSLTTGNIYFIAAGNTSSQELYAYLADQGAQGLKVSRDGGQHFSTLTTLPFGTLLGMLALPGEPGHLLVYGDSGIARSTDNGAHWQVLNGLKGAVFEATTAGPHSPIYASGDAGIYVSNDDGNSFTLVNTQASYASLTASPLQKQLLFGKTGTTIFRSVDGGHTWSPLPHINGNLSNLAVDPNSGARLYLALSYPTQVYRFDQTTNAWSSLTPKTP